MSPRLPQRRPVWGVVVAAVLALALLGLGTSTWMLRSWSDLRVAEPESAARTFEEALVRAGREAYLVISPAGQVRLRRELEGADPSVLQTLHVIAWEPQEGRLLRVDFPFWFVRAKMTRRFNLGTLTSALAQDWEHLDLRVSEEELERRGPGLILDHTRADGARILLWTE